MTKRLAGAALLAIFLWVPRNSIQAGPCSDLFKKAQAASDPDERIRLYTEALAHWTAADGAQNKAAIHNNRGAAYAELERYETALQDFDKALGLKPDYAAAYRNRGQANYGLKRYARAVQDLDKALELQPDLAPAREARDLARAAIDEEAAQRGNKAEAAGLYAKGLLLAGTNPRLEGEDWGLLVSLHARNGSLDHISADDLPEDKRVPLAEAAAAAVPDTEQPASVPEPLKDLVVRCLKADPAARPLDMDEFRTGLGEAFTGGSKKRQDL